MTPKNTLRKKLLEIRRQFSGSAKKLADASIANKVSALIEVEKAKKICIYESFPSEVDTKEIIQYLKKQDKIVVPPDPPPGDVDLFIVPGVAFDRQGNRLGRGGGYYDRLLANVSVPIIGLAYKCQIVSRLPRQLYDIPVSTVIHE